MTKTVFVIAYLALGGVSLLFGNIEPSLLNLGVSADYLTIAKEAIESVIATVGAVAVAVLGLSLPTLPTGRPSTTQAEPSTGPVADSKVKS